ncbi:MAG: hypothetical protein V1650_01300, partial [Candidatus Omnitrophota bacterium]
MLSGHEFLCFGDDYGRMPSTFQRIVKELSRKNKVLWINSLGERKIGFSIRDLKRIIEKLKSLGVKKQGTHDAVIVFSPLAIPLSYNFGIMRKLNTAIIRFQLRNIMKKINMKEPIIMASVRGIFDIIEGLPKKALAYFCLDDYK